MNKPLFLIMAKSSTSFLKWQPNRTCPRQTGDGILSRYSLAGVFFKHIPRNGTCYRVNLSVCPSLFKKAITHIVFSVLPHSRKCYTKSHKYKLWKKNLQNAMSPYWWAGRKAEPRWRLWCAICSHFVNISLSFIILWSYFTSLGF